VILETDGYTIIHDALDASGRQAVRDALAPYFAEGPHGRNDFEGFSTKRIYSLVAKTRVFDRMILDPTILEIAEKLLGPTFLLTASLAINLEPGETAQSMHTDDGFYNIARPRPPVSLSTLWAIDDFTAENGATVILPGSHLWGATPPAEQPTPVPAEMPAGSVLVYYGTLIHCGGSNTTDANRLGISLQYCAGWARQQENYTLEFGKAAQQLDPRLQELIGYNIHPPFMGMIDGRHPRKFLEQLG
jgi:ectoine hydroxylase-related dioxygenase (phytanoyl-CoA dioxygenase family)